LKNLYIGLDVGGTNLRLACCNEKGRIIYDETQQISDITFDDRFENFIIDTVERALERFPQSEWKLKTIGMGVPGTYYQGRVCLCTNIKELNAEYLITHFRNRYDADMRIMNDVKCAALGEYLSGHYNDVNNMVYVNIGTGLSLGMILNGRLYSGEHNASGEIAYYTTSLMKNENSGKPLGLEDVFSGKGLSDMVKQEFSNLIASGGEVEDRFIEDSDADSFNIDTRIIFDEYKKGNKVIVRVLEEALEHFSQALANICAIIDPEVIVFGGGVSSDIGYFIDNIELYLKKSVPFPPKLKRAHLGSNAGIIGAVRLAIGDQNARRFKV